MAGAISDITQYWDAVVERWLAGAHTAAALLVSAGDNPERLGP